MAEIDDVLSSALKRVAEPGDPTGVADAIRARIAAGDTGTPASSSGFRRTGWRRWLPWIGALLLLLLIGGTVAVISLNNNRGTVDVAVTSTPTPEQSARPTPTSTSTPTPTPTVAPPVVAPPVVEPEPEPEPAPGDTTAPTITSAGSDKGDGGVCADGTDAVTVFATATDNVGVAAMSISWSGFATGAAQMAFNGSTWTFTLDPAGSGNGDLNFAITAADAAGNASGTTVHVSVVCPG